MRLEVIKGLVLVALFVMTFGLGFLPVKLAKVAQRRSVNRTSRRFRYRRVISLFSCYAAGVFLATCLLDLFPDVREKISDALSEAEIYTAFPLSEFVMVCGLFLILTVEQIVLCCKESHTVPVKNVTLKKAIADDNDDDKSALLNGPQANFSRSEEFAKRSLDVIRDRPRSSTYSSGTSVPVQRSRNDVTRPLLGGDEHDHSHDIIHPDHSLFRSLLLLLALSLHSIFEGLAVGLQQKAVDVIGIFAALALHKSVLSFSLGLSLVQSELSMPGMVRSVLLFSLSSPLGIGIGMGVTDLSNSQATHMAEGILQGIACGTFLYVTFFEMLPHEFNSSDDRMLKVLFLILGYSTVTLILFLHSSVEKPKCYGEPGEGPKLHAELNLSSDSQLYS